MNTPTAKRSLIGRLLALSWRYRAGCLKVLSFQVVLLALGLTGLGLTGLGIDLIRAEVVGGAPTPRWPFGLTPPADWQPLAVVALVAGAIILLALVRALLNYLYSVNVAQLVERRIMVRLRAEVYDKLQRLSFRFFDQNASGSLINRVTSDTRAVGMFVSGVLLQGVILVLSLGVYLAYMLHLHARLTLACLATVPILWTGAMWFSRKIRPEYLRNRELVDDMVLRLSENVQGVHVVKGFAREPEEIAKFHAATAAVSQQTRKIFRWVSIFSPAIGLLTQLNLVILLAYGGYLVIQGALPLGAGLIVFAGLLQQFSGQVAGLAELTNTVQQSLTGAQRVFEILDAPIEIEDAPDAVELTTVRGALRFDHVSFAFEPGDPTLTDISFAVAPGEVIAILGPTGAGKSALMSLIPRFYDPTAGAVLFDDIDLRRIKRDSLRRRIGIVFQESFLFSNSIAANIAFGEPAATRAQIERAATLACADEFIQALPQGYDTLLGEGGLTLSGGQRQRLALARALLLEPAVLLLDDPTAAVDPETEEDILRAMIRATRGRTTFIVAHRLSTLRRANRVIVLQRGRIVQQGAHAELIERAGPYQRMVRLQVHDDERGRA